MQIRMSRFFATFILYTTGNVSGFQLPIKKYKDSLLHKDARKYKFPRS